MSESKQKIVSPKRSSLRNSTNNLNIKEYIIHKPQKRNSVSWNMGGKLNLDKMKPNFKENENSKNDEKEMKKEIKNLKRLEEEVLLMNLLLLKKCFLKIKMLLKKLKMMMKLKKILKKI